MTKYKISDLHLSYLDNNWVSGTYQGHPFEAKVYEDPSHYGIKDGHVSKLFVRAPEGEVIFNYDRGMDIDHKIGHEIAAIFDHFYEKYQNMRSNFMTTKILKSIAILSLIHLLGCGSAPSTSSSDQFTGTWKGTQTGTQNGVSFSQTLTVIMTNANGSVTGSWAAASGTIGSLSGNVSGSTISMTLTSNGTCPGSATGALTLGASLTGSISGNFGSCGLNVSTLSLSKT